MRMIEPVTPSVRRHQMLSKLGYLSAIDIFRDLSSEEMDWLASITTVTHCERGRVFYTPDAKGKVLFLLKKGRVQLYRVSPEGKKLVVATLKEGSFFGDMPLFGQGMHNSFAEAIEDCQLCIMSQADIERILTNKPQVAMRVVEILGKRLIEAEARLEDIAFKSMPGRLASLLLRLHQDYGDIITGFTHQDLAEMIGTYRETATQIVNYFKSQRLVNIGRKRIELLDLEGLRHVAEH